MQWINTTGGPTIIISEDNLNIWSGIGAAGAAPQQVFEEVDDFMDASRTHYGLACEVEQLIDVIYIAKNKPIIVIGDEPTAMTILMEPNLNSFMLIKWLVGDGQTSFEQFLDIKTLDEINNWDYNFDINISDHELILMDAAASGFSLEDEPHIKFNPTKGVYIVSTTYYAPNPSTSMLIHRFKKKNNI